MTTIFDAVADPTRRQILDLLRERSRTVNELVDALQISQPGVSKQLRVLREVGLVYVRQDAQRHWYELSPAPLAEVYAWLQGYRQLLEARYDRLEELLDKLQTEEQNNEQG
jgi:DNA-binding transcriptional ArsR family regulator